MPTYEYNCGTCGDFELKLKMSEYEATPACPSCLDPARRVIRSPVGFNLPGDGWSSKNGRISRQMAAKNKRLKALTEEQKREQPAVELAPNVEGERTETWAEAQKLAASKGKNTSSYDKMVRQEQSKTEVIR